MTEPDPTSPRVRLRRDLVLGQTVSVVTCADCGEDLSSVPASISQAMPHATARELEGDYWAHKPSCPGPAAGASSSPAGKRRK
jgi:hypothetical protein